MKETAFGDYLRKRRADLGLSQEDVANLIGGTASQAEVSRLERGMVAMPRRSRMEELAAALDVTLGDLLVNSGWFTREEAESADELAASGGTSVQLDVPAILSELAALQASLQMTLNRLNTLEQLVRHSMADGAKHLDPAAD